jgi:CDP-2,3-bis-(O-geranylgeranyl)-sn-glycerol synthase
MDSDAAISHVLRLLYFMLPAYAANMSAPFARYWRGRNPPINARLLGSHKTVVGFALGVLSAMVVTAIQAKVAVPGAIGGDVHWPWLGLAFGVGSMGADALKSLAKRRLRISPGAPWIPFDQLDFAIGALVCVAPLVRLGWGDIAIILAMTFVGDLLVNQLSFRIGVKTTPW